MKRGIFLMVLASAFCFTPSAVNILFGAGVLESKLDQSSPMEKEQYFYRALDYFSLGLYEKSIADLEKSVRIDPYFENGFNYLGIVYARWGKVEKAIENFKTALEIEPMFGDASQNLGRLYLEKGDFPASLKFLKRASFLQFENPQNHYLLGVAYYLSGSPKKSILEYEKALALDPDLLGGQLYYNLGVCYQETGRINLAIKSFKKILKSAPTHQATLNNLALCYQSQGRTQEALKALSIILTQDPENFKAQLNLGNIFLEQKNYPRAQQVYQIMLESFPNDPRIEVNLAYLLHLKGEEKKAVPLWEKLFKEHPGNIQVLNHLVNYFLKTRQFEKAVTHLKLGTQLDPNNGVFWNALGYTLIEQGKELDFALNCVEKALELDPANHAIYLDSLGWYHYKVGNLVKAREIIKHAVNVISVANDERSSEIFYHLAMVSKSLEDEMGLKENLREALLAEPSSHFALEAKKELELLARKP